MRKLKNAAPVTMYDQSEPMSIIANRKLDELIALLEVGNLDNEDKALLQKRFNDAIDHTMPSVKSFTVFEKLQNEGSREALADNLELLLSQHALDSDLSKRFLLLENVRMIVKVAISITMIALGFGMIILPAPPYFEMFTIFYFTANDGVTLMDVISLLVVFTGVYLLITSFLKFRKSKI